MSITLPRWDELTPDEQRTLEGLASTFGPDGTLLNEWTSHMIALELYMLSRHFIGKHNKDNK